jgi:Cdc6-like AAA superfamily ATPase
MPCSPYLGCCWPNLTAEPSPEPAPTADRLPAQPTPLIGREQEVAEIRDAFLREEMRLMTLTGPGGTGKTRLGLQVASELLDHFPGCGLSNGQDLQCI